MLRLPTRTQITLVTAQANRVSDTAALYQALGGGWWNRIQPPAPEQKFDVATEQSKPVVDYPDWLADLWANIAHN
jgi:hypothetical protein